MNKISSTRIILMGQLIVNLPVTVIILLVIIISVYIGIGVSFGAFIGSGVGWYFWDILLKKWVNWAITNGVEKERLFRLGKLGLINFYRNRIFY